jgi:hypothetical protein
MDDGGGGGPAISQREWKSVLHVGLDREYVGTTFIALEESGLNFLLASQLRRPKPMHAVNHAHARTVD